MPNYFWFFLGPGVGPGHLAVALAPDHGPGHIPLPRDAVAPPLRKLPLLLRDH